MIRLTASFTLLMCFLANSGFCQNAVGDGWLWIEGERPSRSQVTPHGWYNDVKQDVLSAGAWLSHFDEQREGTAEYDVETDSGRYTLWLRANPVAARLSMKLDGGAWQLVDFGSDKRGQMNIASDNKPDLRFICWVKVGQFDLQAGKHTLEFKMHSGPQNHGAIDCLVLSRVPFVPSGVSKPISSQEPAGPNDWFAVSLDDDPFSGESVIDVSHLVEAPAGKHGFLKAVGKDLKFEQSREPIKFWGINASLQGNWTPNEMKQAARWYRKHGVNLVRQHTVLGATGLMNAQGEFDPQRLDRYDRWFALLKEQGIYTTWSVIYPHHGAFLQAHDNIDPEIYAELKRSAGQPEDSQRPIVSNDFINLDRQIQDVAWKYFEALLTHVNPYTGLAYKDDPALAFVEYQNESNVFFFTLNVLLKSDEFPRLSTRLRQQFFDFVQEKYTSKESVASAWGGKWYPEDDWEKGELQLMGAHHFGSDGPLYEFAGQQSRTGDYIEFLTKLQREYYLRRESQLRDLGFRGVTVATAWKSGGPAASMANLFADTAADAIDRHNYFGGGDGGHRITEGKVSVDTHLDQPGRGLLGMGLFQVESKPFVVSEWLQMAPNPWKAEAAPLIAFYGVGLQGWDASYAFAMGSKRMGDGWHGLGKYVTETPHYIGQFPALAYAIHNNHIREADVVAKRVLKEAAVFAGKDVLGQSLAGGGFDNKELVGSLTTPPWALAAGRVTIAFDEKHTSDSHYESLHDSEQQRIRSITEQLVWDYGKKYVEVRSPKTQALIGFAANEEISLPDVTIECRTPFVSMIFTPLDDQPLANSKRILLTAMARDKQSGTQYSQDQTELVTVGGPPLLMEPVQARVRFSATIERVTPLDFYGVPKSETVPVDSVDGFDIDGRWATFYYLITR